MKLPLADVRETPEVQLRGGLDMDRVEAMAEFVEQGGQLPPITVVGDDNLLADGHHRYYLALSSGRLDIDANRVPGGAAEAVALAIQLNDIATAKPLTRTQRNEGIKFLVDAGWQKERIAKATGVHPTTVYDIVKTARARERLGTSLNDTTILRIAEMVDEKDQPEFAAAVAEVSLPEPRVREAAKALRANPNLTPREAVAEVTPQHIAKPRSLADVARQARLRIERFTDEPMNVEEVDRDFWQVLDVLAANAYLIPLEAQGLAALLSDLVVRADHYASALRSIEAVSA